VKNGLKSFKVRFADYATTENYGR